jgi:hypothetical protein
VSDRRTDDATLIEAVRILSRTIQTEDGVIPACLAEVATRLAELVEERRSISTLLQKVEILEEEIARLREERRQRESLWTACADKTQLVYGGAFRPMPLPPGPEGDA